MLRDALPALRQGTLKETEQNHSEATCFGRRTPEDGRLDWTKPAIQLHNLVRAVTDPWPGATAYVGASKFIVWKSRARADFMDWVERNEQYKPGRVCSCGAGLLRPGIVG